jgi:hypothetical protein
MKRAQGLTPSLAQGAGILVRIRRNDVQKWAFNLLKLLQQML